MTYDELNAYIIHYLENDRTHSAIMLTGEWGSGKSYYIKNHLIPFIRKEKDRGCVVVSLYEMHDVLEISKGIYFELRAKWINRDSEVFQTGKSVMRTLFKGATSFFNIAISSSDEELREMYESVDLSKKLIILEDVERSSINIIELLAYVNSLVEQDNVKVLIVSNENELIEYSWSEPDEKGNRRKIYTKASLEYLQVKEKTVGDTILFQPDYTESLKSIILSFKNDKLSCFAADEYINEIINIFQIRSCSNLRTFIYACQKTIDIFEKTKELIPKERLDDIFYSLIAFSTHIKKGIFPDWKGTENLSISLSVGNVPLYRFCYDYVRWQKFDILRVREALEEHRIKEIYDHHRYRNDPDFIVIDSFYIHTEKEVQTAINNMKVKLDIDEGFPYFGYGKLMQRLIQLNTILGYDYSVCKERMVKNIRGKSKMIDGELLFFYEGEGLESEEKTQFEEFKREILEALNSDNERKVFSFTYNPNDLSKFSKEVIEKRDEYVSSRSFFVKFDVEKLFNMLVKCTAKQIHDFRLVLWEMYRYARKGDFVESEADSMASFLEKLEGKEGALSTDGIICYQLSLLSENIRRHINQIT